MTATKLLPIKDIDESIVVQFDFSAEAASVSSPQVAAPVTWAADGITPQALGLPGSAQASPTNPAIILMRVAGGSDGTNYGLRCTATSNTGDVLVRAAILPVRRLPV